jgi:hypothetical protein
LFKYSQYKAVQKGKLTFLFKYDRNNPALLHISARHLTTIEDALNVFFNTIPIWNERYNRYESEAITHGIYWFWRDKKQKQIVIITCFRK